MNNKLLATVDIGSMSCIMLIAAFEDAPATPAPASVPAENADTETPQATETRKILVPKLQKVKICKLGEDIYEHGRISEKKIEELVAIWDSGDWDAFYWSIFWEDPPEVKVPDFYK